MYGGHPTSHGHPSFLLKIFTLSLCSGGSLNVPQRRIRRRSATMVHRNGGGGVDATIGQGMGKGMSTHENGDKPRDGKRNLMQMFFYSVKEKWGASGGCGSNNN